MQGFSCCALNLVTFICHNLRVSKKRIEKSQILAENGHYCANKGCKRKVNLVCLDYIGHSIYVDNLTVINMFPNCVWVSANLEM